MATTYELVQLRREGAVAVLTLNRPDKYNAVNQQLHRDLQGALREVARDREVRALVVTGAGKAFCAGQDLTEFAMAGDELRFDEHVRATFNKLVLGLRDLPIPVIAAVNGVAAGAGASLALACDLRICADDAKFLQAFVKIGLVPDTGSTWFLPHLVGVSKALELAWTGDPVSAEEAVAMGMANRVVPATQLLEETMALATRLAGLPTRSIGMTKRAIYRSVTSDLASALEHEAQVQQAAGQTHDHREGVSAFLEKREPQFTGS